MNNDPRRGRLNREDVLLLWGAAGCDIHKMAPPVIVRVFCNPFRRYF